jgi:hypothetical protein
LQTDDKAIGAGNYGFVSYPGCPGGACLRDALAGGTNFCFTPGTTLTTSPGQSTGPSQQGMNTRFGLYAGPVSQSQYPPDVITSNSPVIYYSTGTGNYKSRLANEGSYNFPLGTGVPQRRVVLIPVINCGTGINGRSDVPIIGAACFFLTRTLTGKGDIYGQLLPNCEASGGSGTPPGGGLLGPIKFVLYQDPDYPRGS